MSSIRRLISSRLNAAHSTGPKTTAGKLRSSRNALRHGCRSRKPRLDVEIPPSIDYTPILEEHLAALQPSTPAERQMVEQIAAARAREILVQLRENDMWRKAAEPTPALPQLTWADVWRDLCNTPGFASIHRYEGACRRTYRRALAAFHTLRRIQKNCTNEATLCFPNPGARLTTPYWISARWAPAPPQQSNPNRWEEATEEAEAEAEADPGHALAGVDPIVARPGSMDACSRPTRCGGSDRLQRRPGSDEFSSLLLEIVEAQLVDVRMEPFETLGALRVGVVTQHARAA